MAAQRIPNDAGEILRVVARRSQGSTTVEVILDLDAGTSQPKAMAIRLDSPDRAFDLHIRPQKVSSAVLKSYAPDPFLRLPAAGGRAPRPTASEPEAPVDVMAREVEVRFALHRAGSCLGEPLEVLRTPAGRIVVRGVVSSRGRRDQLAALLASPLAAGWVSLEVQPSSELYRSLQAGPVRRSVQPAGAGRPLSAAFRGLFGPGEEASRAAERTAGELLAQSDELAAEGNALRSLVGLDAVPGPAGASTRAARLLDSMIRDHAAAMRRHSSAISQLLQSRLDPIGPPPAAAPAHVLRPAELAERGQQAVASIDRLLFEPASGPARRLLANTLAAMQTLSDSAAPPSSARVTPE